ncbi:MAG: hypothetical protein WA738_09440 [Candidatus Angelobacter sp.]
MFQGTTIEELINSVVRAEEHAHQEKITGSPDRAGFARAGAEALERQYPLPRFEWRQQMVEVA